MNFKLIGKCRVLFVYVHGREVLSLALLNCQHLPSCALGKENKDCLTSPLQCHDDRSDGYSVTHGREGSVFGMGKPAREMLCALGRTEKDGVKYKEKSMNCLLLEYSF